MIKKTLHNNVLLANTKGQPLKEHSISTALYGHLLLKSLKFKADIEKKLNEYLIYSALLHDIGKVSSSFQKYIKKKRETDNYLGDMPMDAESDRPPNFKGPFHNEISWAYIANFIDFRNNKTRNIVRHSVYWHHPANYSDKKDKLYFENSEILFKKVQENLKEDVPKLLNDMYRFVKDLFNAFYADYYVNDFNGQNCLKEPNKNSIDTIQYPEFFSHKIDDVAFNAKKQLCLNLLLESDRTVSSWSLGELNKFLRSWKTQATPQNKTSGFSILEDWESKPQSKEQYNLAQKMANKKLSICGVDPAGGKTSISLYWWYKCNNKYPLMIALPRQHQVTGLFKSLKQDKERIYSKQQINIEGVFNGKRQYENWKDNDWTPKNPDDLLISDINILVFDRFLSPYYKRKSIFRIFENATISFNS